MNVDRIGSDTETCLLVNNGRTNESILQELTEKHRQRLDDEKSKFQDLTAILDDYKVGHKDD